MENILSGVTASFLAAMATMIGALPVFFLKKQLSRRSYSAMLGISGGIMLAATFFSLLIPAIEKAGSYVASAGFLFGVLFIEITARFVPHEHFFKGKEGPESNIKKIFLFALAITIHNFPEGMSVGVAWALPEKAKALSVSLGIGIQNIPEGASIALPLLALGYSASYCFFISFLSAIVEPIGGIIGITAVTFFSSLLPFALAFASGCMFYVISGEMIQE